MAGYLGEQGVEAVHFLPFLDEGIELSDTLQRQVIHEIDFVGIGDEAIFERLHRDREGRREQADLTVRGAVIYESFQERLEVGGEKFVRLRAETTTGQA